jgi:hypothetical protein
MSGLASNVTVGETGCFTVRVQVKRPNGTDLGRVHFVHTHGVIGGTFTISAGPLGSAAYTNRAIGDTVTLAEEQCSAITAAHLHQEADSPFAPNGYYPDADENDEGSFQNVDVTSQTKYQHYVAFQY